jgi:hypothetical protein
MLKLIKVSIEIKVDIETKVTFFGVLLLALEFLAIF